MKTKTSVLSIIVNLFLSLVVGMFLAAVVVGILTLTNYLAR